MYDCARDRDVNFDVDNLVKVSQGATVLLEIAVAGESF